MGTLKVKLVGVSPLLQHNERMADPLDPAKKRLSKLTDQKKKTDSLHEEIARVEWEGGMYWDEKLGPYVPATWIDAMVKEGARKNKMGKAFEAAVACVEERVPVQYKGPRDLDGMYKAGGFRDRRGVGNMGRKVMRTRPRFAEWSLSFTLTYDEGEVNAEHVRTALEVAGRMVGLGDFRPRMGKFTATTA